MDDCPQRLSLTKCKRDKVPAALNTIERMIPDHVAQYAVTHARWEVRHELAQIWLILFYVDIQR